MRDLLTAIIRTAGKLAGFVISVAILAYVGQGATASAQAADVMVLSGDVAITQTLVVSPGQTLRFDPSTPTTVEISGNLVIEGTLEMKPVPGVTHTLRFTGVTESTFVGGGMEVLESDRGLWVVGAGRLDIQGSPKAGWNRTGTDPTWSGSDELRVAPTAEGDYAKGGFAEFSMGSPVPRADPTLPPAEVINLSRNVRIEGTAGGRSHVTIMSTQPQTIRYAAFRFLGPRQPSDGYTEGVIGRYPIHFHHAGSGSRGSIVEGNVIRDSGNRAIVPHHSDGITVRDNVAYGVLESAYWWDPGDDHASNDVIFDHNFAGWISDDPSFRGYDLTGFELGKGSGNIATSNAAAGVLGNKGCSGFRWPSKGSGLWTFVDNVAHNNHCSGIRVWLNLGGNHLIQDFVAYRNGGAGVDHGAYTNNFVYSDLYLFGNVEAGVTLHAYSGPPKDGRSPQSWSCVTVANSPTALLVVASAAPEQGLPVLFDGLSFLNAEAVTLDQSAIEAGQALDTRVVFQDAADCQNDVDGSVVVDAGGGAPGDKPATDPAVKPAAAKDPVDGSESGAALLPETTTANEPADGDHSDHNDPADAPASTPPADTRPGVSDLAAAPGTTEGSSAIWLWVAVTIVAAGLVALEVRRRNRERVAEGR